MPAQCVHYLTVPPSDIHRLSEGKTRAVQVFDQTQAAFVDTTAFDEAKEELSVSQFSSERLHRIV